MSIQYHKADPVELEFAFRALPDGSSTFEGYAAVFNRRSKVLHDQFARSTRGYRETIMPGAFKRSIGTGRRITFVVDHDDRQMVSSSPTGPLRLAEDSTGLHVESPWPSTPYTDSVRALHDAGERLGMSVLFGTTPKHEQSAWAPDGSHRTVSDAVLRHTSVLATMEPAYDGTVATFRALADITEADVEDVDALMEALRDGRRLDEDEYNLLTRLSEAVKPEQDEQAPTTTEPPDEASRAATDRWLARLAEIEAELTRS
jgi:HK97 family phage prohead protease